MKTFEFVTTCTMKPYNHKRYWIDDSYIRPISINARNLNDAILQYRVAVKDKYYVTITDNAIKNKSPMYIDTKTGETKQIGYVITAMSEFQCDNKKLVKQYIELWVTIKTIIETDFPEMEVI